MDVIQECRMILAAARPANGNAQPIRLARQDRVDQLLRELDAIKPRATLYTPPERPAVARAIVHPAAWFRREIERAG